MRATISYCLLLLSCSLYGCATIIQGTTQDVPVDAPQGTKVTSASGMELPLFYKHSLRDSGSYLRLNRGDNYFVRFSYKGQHVTAAFDGDLQIGWVILGIFTSYGIIIDAVSGAWNSFDGVAVRFPVDTSQRPYLEAYEPTRQKIGVSILAGSGISLPMSDFDGFVPFSYSFGAGYHFTSRLMLFGEFGGGSNIDIMPRYSDHKTSANLSTYFAGARLRFQDDIYISAGGGLAQISTGELEYIDETRPDRSTGPVNKMLGAFFGALGTSGKYGYFELRHTFGVPKIPLSNGETGQLEITSFNFGLNLHF